MPDLIAQGPTPQDRWRRPLPNDGETVVIGRTASGWAVPWDDRISRSHVELKWEGKRLSVVRVPDARNPIFFRGVRRDDFHCAIGEHFVIGQTTFSLVDQRIRVATQPAREVPSLSMTEHTFQASDLRQARYRNADHRINVLSRLPELIQGSSDNEELFVRMVSLLMQGIERAEFIALVASPSDSELVEDESTETSRDGLSESLGLKILESGLRILHWDSRNLSNEQFSPSTTLIRKAIDTKQSVLHIWSRAGDAGDNASGFTQTENIDWAYCTPLTSEACPGWAIYVAGSFDRPTTSGDQESSFQLSHEIQDDLKFTELASSTLGVLRQSRLLQRRQDSLRPFFAPVVRHALVNRDPDQVLAPREANVSVLFCDLRGFSKQSEESSDRLLELLRRVSDALGVMTHHIFDRDGVVGDFHGDAAMGFWGWPFDDPDAVVKAAHAALAIREEFEQASAVPNHPLARFRVGIGIASGRAVAGRIGTTDQVKVTVFGPVVNLAARLESMTKQLHAPILIDETTADRLCSVSSDHPFRLRKIARVLPYGLTTPLMVSEILPIAKTDDDLSNEEIQAYETAVEALQNGKWNDAFRWLHRVPAEDRVKDFLTVFIAQHGRVPPADWQGYIRLPEK